MQWKKNKAVHFLSRYCRGVQGCSKRTQNTPKYGKISINSTVVRALAFCAEISNFDTIFTAILTMFNTIVL